jgi:hypothetical protein
MNQTPGDDLESRLSLALIDSGSEIAGAAVGGALGLIGGPAGVAAGAVGGVVATRTLKRVGSELQGRLLGPRQLVRVGAAFTFAADQISARLLSGMNSETTGSSREPATADRSPKRRLKAYSSPQPTPMRNAR